MVDLDAEMAKEPEDRDPATMRAFWNSAIDKAKEDGLIESSEEAEELREMFDEIMGTTEALPHGPPE
jgi:hypothetical protein